MSGLGWDFGQEELAWVFAAGMAACAGVAWRLWAQLRQEREERWRERLMREELEAYAEVDPGVSGTVAGGMAATEATKALAVRMCRVVAERSAFSKAAMILRDAEGRLYCAASVGVDDLTVRAMEAWGATVVQEERGGVRRAGQKRALSERGGKSFAIALGEWKSFDPEVGARVGKKERRRWRRGLVAPMRAQHGKLLGAIVVCADGTKPGRPVGLERAMGPLETLAARVGGSSWRTRR